MIMEVLYDGQVEVERPLLEHHAKLPQCLAGRSPHVVPRTMMVPEVLS